MKPKMDGIPMRWKKIHRGCMPGLHVKRTCKITIQHPNVIGDGENFLAREAKEDISVPSRPTVTHAKCGKLARMHIQF